jgi:hypothetical protein
LIAVGCTGILRAFKEIASAIKAMPRSTKRILEPIPWALFTVEDFNNTVR